MKKTIVLILTIIMVFIVTVSLADVDINGLSFDELIALKEKINLAIWSSNEWQEVTVSQGVWKIGKEIPAGHWTIKMAPNDKVGNWCSLTYCSKLDETGKNGDYSGVYLYQQLSRPGSDYPAPEEYDIELKEGMYLIIEQKDVVFSPYTGKDFGFK